MSFQDNLFYEDVEHDVTIFARDKTHKRVLVFPPVNNYRRYIIHQLVQDRFPDLLHTFSIGQGSARRTVVCYKSDVIRLSDPKLNTPERKTSPAIREIDGMGVEGGRRSPSVSPDLARLQRQVKSVPTIEIYRPPAARRSNDCSRINETQIQSAMLSSSAKNARQKRPDRAVYIPRHRRSFETEKQSARHMEASRTNVALLNGDSNINTNNNFKLQDECSIQQSINNMRQDSILCNARGNHSSPNKDCNSMIKNNQFTADILNRIVSLDSEEISIYETHGNIEHSHKLLEKAKDYVPVVSDENKDSRSNIEKESNENVASGNLNENDTDFNVLKPSDKTEIDNKQVELSIKCDNTTSEHLNSNEVVNRENRQEQSVTSNVLIISDSVHNESEQFEEIPVESPEKKVKKVQRQKSKPVPPPSPPVKINRDECDWDSLFDDNGDCLDPTLIEELTSAVGEVMIEQPKNDYKPYSKPIEVSNDEYAHVVEIYNFPSEFKTSDLAAVFSPFKNGGFELKWVDDTHCLGVFSSPLIAAEVLASNHPFVKTRPLSEATALSRTKAKRSAEFLQPYRNRPETCAALARRLVTGALGVKLATARQEREHEKNVLREAKEKRRLANKQREDVWEGIIPEK